MNYNIAIIKGDGIGPEVVTEGVKLIEKIGQLYGHEFDLNYLEAGGSAIDKFGIPLPEETLELAKKSDSVLLGAVGGSKWDHMPGDKRPERALLGIREALGLYTNLRPAITYKALIGACPLRPEIIGDGMDIMVVRELTGGMYFGERGRKTSEQGNSAYDIEEYSYEEIRRIAVKAFEIAMTRKKHVTSMDKANVLESSRLWRETVIEISKDYPEVKLDHMYIDNATMQLIRDPHQFDVILTTNMFGDIISDEASQITGSIGMLPSASIGASKLGMYEPIHGSAPDIAGQNVANPIATMLSIAMMFRYSLDLNKEADAIELAVDKVLEQNYRTKDIMSAGMTLVGTSEMGKLVLENLK